MLKVRKTIKSTCDRSLWQEIADAKDFDKVEVRLCLGKHQINLLFRLTCINFAPSKPFYEV